MVPKSGSIPEPPEGTQHALAFQLLRWTSRHNMEVSDVGVEQNIISLGKHKVKTVSDRSWEVKKER